MANEYLFTEFIFVFAQTGVLNFNSFFDQVIKMTSTCHFKLLS